MASSITAAEFKDALSRYGTVLKGLSKEPKEGQTNLEELDKFRYQYAPMNFSKNAGKTLDLEAVQKLAEWKVRHGTYRPSLVKLVSSNTDESVAEITTEAFEYYEANKDDIAGTIEKLRALKGVGPATASLILAVYDPHTIVFFSDELYSWLVKDGEKVSLKYVTKEFEELFSVAKDFISRMKCSPIDLEKVAFTLIQENKPIPEPKEQKQPSGRGRGRPPKPDSEKKPKKVTVPGRGRGRPAGTTKAKEPNVVEKKVKEPKVKAEPKTKAAAKSPKAKKEKAVATPADGATKKRGRPGKNAVAELEEAASESDAEKPEEEEEEAKTPASKKRKSTATPSSRSAKKAKA